MFQKSIVQENMFKPASWVMEGRTRKVYEDECGWHNQFRLQVTNKINEELFKPLFSAENGAPAASIRVLVGMMILKEGQGEPAGQDVQGTDCGAKHRVWGEREADTDGQ